MERTARATRTGFLFAALLLAAWGVSAHAQDGPARAPGDVGQRASEEIKRKLARLDAAADGFAGEALQERAAESLDGLAAIWESGATADALAELLHADFSVPWLRPANLATAFEDGAFRVLRVPAGADPGASGDQEHAGPAGLVVALNALASPFDGPGRPRLKLKIVRAVVDAELLRATVRATATGSGADGAVQVNAEWRCLWSLAGELLLRDLEVVRYEEVHGPPVLFRGRPRRHPLFMEKWRR